MEIKDIIRRARHERGWRQEDLAAALGVTKQAVQQWEAGETTPRGSRLAKLRSVLALPLPEPDDEPLRVRRAIADNLMRFATVSERPAGSRPAGLTGDVLFEEMRKAIPAEFERYIDVQYVIKGRPYRFHYMSPKVVVRVVLGTPNGAATTHVRLASWRLAVAKAANNDTQMSDRHYLCAVLAPPFGEPLTVKLSEYTINEARIMGLPVETFLNAQALVQRIVELENTPTESEEFFEAHKEDMQRFSADDDFNGIDDLL